MKDKIKLIHDCWVLVNCLVLRQKDTIFEWTSKDYVCLYHPDEFHVSKNKNAHDICPHINECKNYINDNVEVFGHIIITNARGDLKIPTTEEANIYLDNEIRLILRRLKRYWNKVKAIGIKNQFTIRDAIIEVTKEEKNE